MKTYTRIKTYHLRKPHRKVEVEITYDEKDKEINSKIINVSYGTGAIGRIAKGRLR